MNDTDIHEARLCYEIVLVNEAGHASRFAYPSFREANLRARANGITVQYRDGNNRIHPATPLPGQEAFQ